MNSDAALWPAYVRLSRSLCKCATAFRCRELVADHSPAERVVAAADLDDLLAFDALQTFTVDELLLRVDLEHHDLRLEIDALERAVHVQHRVLLRVAAVHLDVAPRDDVAEVLVDAVFGIFELFDGATQSA